MNNWDTMTNQERNAALAEKLGWVWYEAPNGQKYLVHPSVPVDYPPGRRLALEGLTPFDYVPDFNTWAGMG